MPHQKNDILQGTLGLLILKTLTPKGRMHGYAITAHIQQRLGRPAARRGRLALSGAAPHDHEGWLRAEWGMTDKNRQARFYRITAAGPEAARARGRELGAAA